MKIIHTADIHLESKMNKLGNKKARIRQSEIRDSFFKVIDYANDNGVSIILIAGDFFDDKKVKLSTLKELTAKINTVPKIDFLYLNGNHDDSKVFYNEKIGELPENLKIFNEKTTAFKYGHVHIKAFDIEKYNNSQFINKLDFNPNEFNILMLHGLESDIPFSKLKGKHIDYLALGDIHIPDIEDKKLDTRGRYGYSGVLEPRGFDELGKRGFFLLEINNLEYKRTFIENNKRTYHIVEVDITGLDNYTVIENAIKNEIKYINKEDILRVVLIGSYNYETVKDYNTLLKNLENNYYYAELIDNSKLDYTTIDFENEISLRGEVYRLIMSSDYPEHEKEKILTYSLQALRDEVIG